MNLTSDETELTAEQAALLTAIVGGRRAWASVAELAEAGHAAETLASLVGLDLIEHWRKPHVGELPEDLANLAPCGAAVCRVELDETIVVRGGVELEIPRRVELGSASTCVVLPRYRGHARMPLPGLVADPSPGPEALADVDDGGPDYLIDEWTGKPVTRFVGDGGEGVPVIRERRTRRGQESGRRACN